MKKIWNYLVYIFNRWVGKMPAFFRWIFWIFGLLAGACATCQVYIVELLSNPIVTENISPDILKNLKTILGFCVGVAVVAKLTTIKPPEIKKPQ